jgi:hypothetical protein
MKKDGLYFKSTSFLYGIKMKKLKLFILGKINWVAHSVYWWTHAKYNDIRFGKDKK